ncbi:MAG: LuxR C-terminal-related transcriptional regulator [Synechococcales bacterium]|nr:LuxR C-terminal-related transcriptional regulator [Synechococcales bacterium]
MPNGASASCLEPPALLEGVIEGLIDGILILSERSEIVYSNSYARQLCQHLSAHSDSFSAIPKQIWRICKALIDSRTVFPDQPVMIEDEIGKSKSETIRVRARWVQLDHATAPYLLVMLEDRHQSAKRRAIAEGQRYGLTARENEVWLYRCIDYTYEEIAAELHITINTVKKHIKSINLKRDLFLCSCES